MTNIRFRTDNIELLLHQCAELAADGTGYDSMEVIDMVNGGTGDWYKSNRREFDSADDSEKIAMCFKACYDAIEALIDADIISSGEDLIGRSYEDPEGSWLIIESGGQNVTVKSLSDFTEEGQHPMVVTAEEAEYFIKHDLNGQLKPWYQE